MVQTRYDLRHYTRLNFCLSDTRIYTVLAVKVDNTTLQLENGSKIYLAQPSIKGEKGGIYHYHLLYLRNRFYVLRLK